MNSLNFNNFSENGFLGNSTSTKSIKKGLPMPNSSQHVSVQDVASKSLPVVLSTPSPLKRTRPFMELNRSPTKIVSLSPDRLKDVLLSEPFSLPSEEEFFSSLLPKKTSTYIESPTQPGKKLHPLDVRLEVDGPLFRIKDLPSRTLYNSVLTVPDSMIQDLGKTVALTRVGVGSFWNVFEVEGHPSIVLKAIRLDCKRDQSLQGLAVTINSLFLELPGDLGVRLAKPGFPRDLRGKSFYAKLALESGILIQERVTPVTKLEIESPYFPIIQNILCRMAREETFRIIDFRMDNVGISAEKELVFFDPSCKRFIASWAEDLTRDFLTWGGFAMDVENIKGCDQSVLLALVEPLLQESSPLACDVLSRLREKGLNL